VRERGECRDEGIARGSSVGIRGHWGESYAFHCRCQPRKPLSCL
jgi:hypothetical protein